jgi:hypothetical protein
LYFVPVHRWVFYDSYTVTKKVVGDVFCAFFIARRFQ